MDDDESAVQLVEKLRGRMKQFKELIQGTETDVSAPAVEFKTRINNSFEPESMRSPSNAKQSFDIIDCILPMEGFHEHEATLDAFLKNRTANGEVSDIRHKLLMLRSQVIDQGMEIENLHQVIQRERIEKMKLECKVDMLQQEEIYKSVPSIDRIQTLLQVLAAERSCSAELRQIVQDLTDEANKLANRVEASGSVHEISTHLVNENFTLRQRLMVLSARNRNPVQVLEDQLQQVQRCDSCNAPRSNELVIAKLDECLERFISITDSLPSGSDASESILTDLVETARMHEANAQNVLSSHKVMNSIEQIQREISDLRKQQSLLLEKRRHESNEYEHLFDEQRARMVADIRNALSRCTIQVSRLDQQSDSSHITSHFAEQNRLLTQLTTQMELLRANENRSGATVSIIKSSGEGPGQ